MDKEAAEELRQIGVSIRAQTGVLVLALAWIVLLLAYIAYRVS